MSPKSTMIALSDLVFDEKIYPRQNIDEQHLRMMCVALESDIQLPPIIVERKTKRIVDGVHRYHANLRREAKRISCVLKDYKSDADLFKEAVLLNTGVGLKLGIDDSLKVIQIGEQQFGLKEIELAAMLRTSIAHLRVIKARFASYEETVRGVRALRKVALKGSTRHLAGETLTKAQYSGLELAPGQSYLLTIRQLISACECNLLPPRDRHPTLWLELEKLHDLLMEMLSKAAA